MAKFEKSQIAELENCIASSNSLIEACSELNQDCVLNNSLHCAQLYGEVEQKARDFIKSCNNLTIPQEPAYKEIFDAGNEAIKVAERLSRAIKSGADDVNELCEEMVESCDRCYEVCSRYIK